MSGRVKDKKVKVHTLDIAHLHNESSPQKRSGMARVLKGSHSFTCTPTRSSAVGMSHTCLSLPSYSWYSFTDPGRMEWVSALPNFGVLLYLCLQFLTQNDQIRHGNTTMRRGVFLGQRRHCIYTLMCRAVCLRQWNFLLSPPWLAVFSFSLCLASVYLSVCLFDISKVVDELEWNFWCHWQQMIWFRRWSGSWSGKFLAEFLPLCDGANSDSFAALARYLRSSRASLNV